MVNQPGIHLVDLLELCPTLLDMCLGLQRADEDEDEDTPETQMQAIQTLRLVNKAASRVSLLGLREYTLFLNGDDEDTNPVVFSMLQHTKLQKLGLHFRAFSRKSFLYVGCMHLHTCNLGLHAHYIVSVIKVLKIQ